MFTMLLVNQQCYKNTPKTLENINFIFIRELQLFKSLINKTFALIVNNKIF